MEKLFSGHVKKNKNGDKRGYVMPGKSTIENLLFREIQSLADVFLWGKWAIMTLLDSKVSLGHKQTDYSAPLTPNLTTCKEVN